MLARMRLRIRSIASLSPSSVSRHKSGSAAMSGSSARKTFADGADESGGLFLLPGREGRRRGRDVGLAHGGASPEQGGCLPPEGVCRLDRSKHIVPPPLAARDHLDPLTASAHTISRMSARYFSSRFRRLVVPLHGQHASYRHRVAQCGFNATLTVIQLRQRSQRPLILDRSQCCYAASPPQSPP